MTAQDGAPDALAGIAPIAGIATVEATVTNQVRALLVDGHLDPGVRLRYRDLALRLGVSVTPVRIAVRDLTNEGLLEVTERGLVRVAPYSLEELDEVYSQRAGLEGLLARRGAEQRSPSTLETMQERFRVVQQTARSDQRPAYVEAIWQFRLPCYEAAGRPKILRTVQLLLHRCARYNRLVLADPHRFDGSLEFQQAFLSTYEAGDSAGAESVIRDAMDWSREYLVARLGEQISNKPVDDV